MNTDLILANLHKHIALTSEEKRSFLSMLEAKQVARKSFVLKQDAPCPYIFFVNEGLMRAFYLSEEGKDSTVMFAIQDWWITDMYCFVNERPAMVNIQAVEGCELFQLSKHNLEHLYRDIPKFEKFFRILMQNAYCREQLRIIQNLSLSAEERYHNFISKYPQIAHRVTQKQIASYLGITPEFLSTIRARKVQ